MEMWEKCNCTSRQIKFVLNKYCSSFQLPSTLTLSVRERVRIESSKFPFPLSLSLSLSSSIASNGKVHSKIPFQWEHDSLVSQLTARRKKEEALHNSRSQGLKEIERVNAELCNCARIDPLSFRYAQSKQMLVRPNWLYSIEAAYKGRTSLTSAPEQFSAFIACQGKKKGEMVRNLSGCYRTYFTRQVYCVREWWKCTLPRWKTNPFSAVLQRGNAHFLFTW